MMERTVKTERSTGTVTGTTLHRSTVPHLYVSGELERGTERGHTSTPACSVPVPLAKLASRMRVPVRRLIDFKRLGLLPCQAVDGVTVATEADVRRALELDADDQAGDL